MIIFSTESVYYIGALALRNEVLRKPLGVSFTQAEFDQDKEDVHFAILAKEEVIACLTLSAKENSRIKMRQVAVKVCEQGKGRGKSLAAFAEKYAVENGFKTIFCHARKPVVPFYEKMGYRVCGNEFIEVGVAHLLMEKELE